MVVCCCCSRYWWSSAAVAATVAAPAALSVIHMSSDVDQFEFCVNSTAVERLREAKFRLGGKFPAECTRMYSSGTSREKVELMRYNFVAAGGILPAEFGTSDGVSKVARGRRCPHRAVIGRPAHGGD